MDVFRRIAARVKVGLRLLATGDWRKLRYYLWVRHRHIDLRRESVAAMGQSRDRAHRHSNSGGPDLEFVLKALDISETDSVIDIGCGKGGALITLARFPFRKVAGIEISEQLVPVAAANLARAGVAGVDVARSDAGEFVQLDGYTFVYMYNPFPCAVMEQFMQNLATNLRHQPRRLTLIYKMPKCHDVVASTSGFRKISEFHHSPLPFYVYVYEPAQAELVPPSQDTSPGRSEG